MSPALAHALAAIALLLGGGVFVVCFAVWWLDNQDSPHIGTWRLADGRLLVRYRWNEQEWMALGSGSEWLSATLDSVRVSLGEQVEQPEVIAWLTAQWEHEQRARRRRRARARRIARKRAARLAAEATPATAQVVDADEQQPIIFEPIT